MIKILFFIPDLSGGGAEKVLCNLVNHMDQTQFDITVHTIEDVNEKEYLVPGIHYRSIKRQKQSLSSDPKRFKLWYRIMAQTGLLYRNFIKGEYDIEAAYLETDATKVISASNNKNALKLAWVHCDLSMKEGISENLQKVRKQYEKFDKIICVSEDTKEAYVKLFGTEPEAVVFHNIVDDEEIYRKSEEPLTLEKEAGTTYFLASGRLTWQKAFDKLIQAFSKLRNEGYRYHLWILGDGPEREKLEKLLQETNTENEIELLGFQKNPYPYMKAADCTVCSSRYEGMSTVVLESLILGNPVITTPCTGMKELLGNSEYGLIAEDSESGLFESVKTFLDSDDLKKQLEEKAAVRGLDFRKEKNIKITQDFFMRELRNKRKES